MPDTFGLKRKLKKLKLYDMKICELKDETINQKITNQLFLFEGKTDLDGKPVETIMPLKDFEAFESYYDL